MSETLTRRKLITTGLAGLAGIAGISAAERIANGYGLVPPDGGGIWGVGETLTYAAQRMLMSHHSMAREFSPCEISKSIPVTNGAPQTDPYQRHLANKFRDWRLMVDGIVARPSSFSLTEIQRMPARTQITHQACEQGWSFIAQWSGVPLSYVLNRVGVSTRAKYVVFWSFDPRWDSLDLTDAFHPQTLLAYNMNGQDLPPDYGAPLRVRVPRQLGYKSVKFLTRITVVEDIKKVGDGRGSALPSHGFSWYAGI